TGLPLANEYVGLSIDVPAFNSGLGPAYVLTDADGRYRLEGIPAGDWYIVTQSSGPYGDAGQIWPGVPCNDTGCDYTAASLVTIVDGEDTPDIDFAFHPDVLIRGRVTDATTGAGLANVTVDTFWAFWLPFGVAVYPMTTTQTADDGSYVLYGYGNRVGDEDTQYYVASIGSAPHIDVSYPDHAYWRTDDIVAGTPMTLHHGDELDGIDLALPLGSAISGTVYDIHTGRALPESSIVLFKSDATILWTGLTDDSGRFTTPAWYPDTYYLEATWYQGGFSACGVYQDRPCPEGIDPLPSVDPTPLTLATGEIRVGVDFHLDVDVILRDSFDGVE
ncbi:MAG TPA: carboxypeptidase-like regulatory domain-containing protein, partial [Rhodanobacteraceae bacterium]|nr:carboxypeptidase-like regulatory domain-containing protein [Rhodanobacteraceae bacterium]